MVRAQCTAQVTPLFHHACLAPVRSIALPSSSHASSRSSVGLRLRGPLLRRPLSNNSLRASAVASMCRVPGLRQRVRPSEAAVKAAASPSTSLQLRTYPFMVFPLDPHKIAWDYIVMLLVAFNVVELPYSIAFTYADCQARLAATFSCACLRHACCHVLLGAHVHLPSQHFIAAAHAVATLCRAVSAVQRQGSCVVRAPGQLSSSRKSIVLSGRGRCRLCFFAVPEHVVAAGDHR